MKIIEERLAKLDPLKDLDATTRSQLARIGKWFSLPGGAILYEQKSPSDYVYFVLSGRLVVSGAYLGTGIDKGVATQATSQAANQVDQQSENILGYIGAGEPVGEMSLLLDERHSATVYALRDTQVLAIRHEDFDRLYEDHGDLASMMSRYILRRFRRSSETFQKASPKVFAFIGSSPSIDVDHYANLLCKEVRKLNLKANWFEDRDEAPDPFAFEKEEASQDVIILSARVDGSPWYRFVLRHADRFFVYARRDAKPPKPFPLASDNSSPARKFRMVDLVMLQEGKTSSSVLEWRDALQAQRIFCWRDGETPQRIARVITGRSVGIVLSGGGARAYAHVGAVRAMREKGIPIDFACGSSMGAIIAASVALGWSDDEVDRRMKAAFVDTNPLSDFQLPVVSLAKGRVVEARLKEHFTDVLIEDMVLPFFCVSSDLTDGSAYVHRTGSLVQALRATISLPGILPPIVKPNHLLVDGALINNFPTDLMSLTHRGVNIGIDVARRGTIDPEDYRHDIGFWGWVRHHGFRTPPPIVGLLMRSATTRRESTMLYHPADIMISPAVQGVDLRAWKSYDLAVEEGYKATMEALEANQGTLKLIT